MPVRTYDVLNFPSQREAKELWGKREKNFCITIELILQGGEDEAFIAEISVEDLALFSSPDYRSKHRDHSVGVYGTSKDKHFGEAKKGYVINITYNLDKQEGTAETRAL